MEDLPPEYVEHNLPFILLSGLVSPEESTVKAKLGQRQDHGTKLSSERSVCQSEQSKVVLDQLMNWDGSQLPWNAVALPSTAGALRYRFSSTARTYTLPPRKAAPIPQSPSNESGPMRQISTELHSSLSPLSPGSPVFPDGIMTPLWFSKHQVHVPCLMIAFFELTVAGGSTEDDAIKADINTLKSSLSRSGYRTRLTAVLISDRSIIQSPEMEERFSSIRRATSSDVKTGLFFMPPMPSSGEVATFIQGMLITLQPVCIEYYRELTKHARRKKTRGSTPLSPTLPTHTAARTLPTPGWNARYEIKQAVFAEYRQEMDVAERHYSQAIEDLCNAEGVFEMTPSWSPRWDEIRLLCDSVAIRIIRCHLWNGSTTAAVQFWYAYQARMKALIDGKGKGTHSYGWLAWETRWARIMAQLIQLAELPMLDPSHKLKNDTIADPGEYHIYYRPEKVFQDSLVQYPMYLLHHPGYWHRLALNRARARHDSAMAIPNEDTIPPGQSPASSVANRAQSYDTYLVPEPHEEHANARKTGLVNDDFGQINEQAVHEYLNRGQRRMAERLTFDFAQDLVREESYSQAMEVLVPIWDASSWRDETWHGLFAELLTTLNKCSILLKNAEIAFATAWEQLSVLDEHINSVNSTAAALAISTDTRVAMDFSNAERLHPLSTSFAFEAAEAYAGDPIRCQLFLKNNMSMDLKIVEIKVMVSGNHDITIKADGQNDAQEFHHIHLEDEQVGAAPSSLTAKSTRILDFETTFKHANSVELEKVIIKLECGNLLITHTIDDTTLLQSANFCTTTDEGLVTEHTRQEDTTKLTVRPKPPKADIVFQNLRKHYYTGETILLALQIVNAEIQSISGGLTQQVRHSDDTIVPSELSILGSDDLSIRNLGTQAIVTAQLSIEGVATVTQPRITVELAYTLVGSQERLVKTAEISISIILLLDAKWNFGPLLYTDDWPSYFDASKDETIDQPAGIPHRWKAGYSARSLADDTIIVHASNMHLAYELDDTVCSISPMVTESQSVMSSKSFAREFELLTTKISADDRRPSHLNLTCTVLWSRQEETTKHTSEIAVPRITLPSSEPRVLCTVKGHDIADAEVQYWLENPSTHFLTFALTMEASDSFAFSGLKYRTLSLAPLSRVCIPYQIVLHPVADDADGHWIWPNLQVVDSYYQKSLRVQPAGTDVKLHPEHGVGVFVRTKHLATS